MLDIYRKWAPFMDAEGTGGGEGEADGDEGKPEGSEGKPEDKKPEGDDPRKLPKYSDEDLDAIIQKKIDKIEAKAKAKADEATRLATMNATEKAEYEKKIIQEELDGYKRKEAISNMIGVARGMLKEKGLTVPDDIIATLVTEDADTTKTAVEAFADMFNATVEDALKEKMKGTPPRTGSPGKSLTRDEIMAIPDGDARRKAIQDNISLFETKK